LTDSTKKSAPEFSSNNPDSPGSGHFSLNRNQLKYLAIFAMLLDHIAWILSQNFYDSPREYALCFVFRTLGRLTAPIMSWFLVQGYIHTSSKKRYAGRLLIFALVSQIPFALVRSGKLWTNELNVIFTLLISFLILCIIDSELDRFPKVLLVILLFALSAFGDWAIFMPFMVLIFYFLKDKRRALVIFYSILSLLVVLADIAILCIKGYHWYRELWQAGMFLFIPLLPLYKGEPGSRHPFHKWIFYVFYPAHLLVLYIIFYMCMAL
jgi:hypothetical protein